MANKNNRKYSVQTNRKRQLLSDHKPIFTVDCTVWASVCPSTNPLWL